VDLAAEAETRAGTRPVTVPLDGRDIAVPPVWDWTTEAVLALLEGQDDNWAYLTLDDDNWDVWDDVDPSADACDDFVVAWQRASGQSFEDMGRMVTILEEHHDRLESDLVVHCNGRDLRDLWRPGGGSSGLTWRLLAVLYAGLPPESQTKTAQTDALGPQRLAELAARPSEGFGPWSRLDMRVASLEDAVNRVAWILMQVNSKEGTKVPKPEPVPRPGVAGKTRRRSGLSDDARNYLQYLRDHQGAMPPGMRMVAR
jgi:hypothetical protein